LRDIQRAAVDITCGDNERVFRSKPTHTGEVELAQVKQQRE